MKAVTPEDAVRVLNEALQAEPKAMQKLFARHRISNTSKLVDHPTIQVGARAPSATTLSALGLINGIFGVDERGYGPVAAVVNEVGTIERFTLTPREPA